LPEKKEYHYGTIRALCICKEVASAGRSDAKVKHIRKILSQVAKYMHSSIQYDHSGVGNRQSRESVGVCNQVTLVVQDVWDYKQNLSLVTIIKDGPLPEESSQRSPEKLFGRDEHDAAKVSVSKPAYRKPVR